MGCRSLRSGFWGVGREVRIGMDGFLSSRIVSVGMRVWIRAGIAGVVFRK